MAYNPTVAKELALFFLEKIEQRPTPTTMARTIKQIKEMMEFGYTDEEIKYAIEYALKANPNVYSFGYVATLIDKALKLRIKKPAPVHAVDLHTITVTKESEVEKLDELSERNKRKSSEFGVQSRKRKKYNFDLFEGQ